MSRNVRCRWCYSTGHNRRGCEQYKKYIEENPNSSYAARENRFKERAKNRSCSYCGETKHNKKTCLQKAVHIQTLTKLNKAYRKYWFQTIRDANIGVASLMQSNVARMSYQQLNNGERSSVTVEQPMYMITDIKWDQVSVTQWKHSYHVEIEFLNVKDYSGAKNLYERSSLNELLERNTEKALSTVPVVLPEAEKWFSEKDPSIESFVSEKGQRETQRLINTFLSDEDREFWHKKPPEIRSYMDS